MRSGLLTDRPGCGHALENGAKTMNGLLLKCAALVVMIHGFRVIGRFAGPRWSGLALGLPSTTAIVLILCGWEQGSAAAVAMADSSLLGLTAAVALPLAYVYAVRLGWSFSATFGASIGGYLVVAIVLGCLPALGTGPRVAIATLAIVSATHRVRRLHVPGWTGRRASISTAQTMVLRTSIPVIYGLAVSLLQRMGGPAWAGLLSTFPSISLVVLAVTHLEAGPVESSRIAKVLPAGNTSTLAFLAAFRFISPTFGVGGGSIGGYAAALLALADHGRNSSSIDALTPRQNCRCDTDLASRNFLSDDFLSRVVATCAACLPNLMFGDPRETSFAEEPAIGAISHLCSKRSRGDSVHALFDRPFP